MAPAKLNKRALRFQALSAQNGRATRSHHREPGKRLKDNIPDVYNDMLNEATPSPTSQSSHDDERPLKKRRTGKSSATRSVKHSTAEPLTSSPRTIRSTDGEGGKKRPTQTTIEDSEDSEESDMEWEEVNLNEAQHTADEGEEEEDQDEDEDQPGIQDLSIVLGSTEDRETIPKRPRRKGVTAADRKLRLDVHKMHLLYLLYHVHIRNAWCNDHDTQSILRKLAPPKMVTSLLPDPDYPPLRVAKSFKEGLNSAKVFWHDHFRVTAHGMRRAQWAADQGDMEKLSRFDNLDPPMTRQLFRKAAVELNGSQDLGAQLLCAFLRSIGVEARLVCSLQCLPFAATMPTTSRLTAPEKKRLYLDPVTNTLTSKDPSITTPPSRAPMPSAVQPKRVGRMGRAGRSSRAIDKGKPPTITAIPRIKPTITPQYPVFWVEAFNSAHQKWIAIDPLATCTVDQPTQLEPPLSSKACALSYAIAFEEDGTAHDVTRRYAKAFNAKTRRTRVDNTEQGSRWLKQAMKVFKRSKTLDRDQVEHAALSRQEAAEGLPKNIQDFKDHPIYVLERHLKRTEVLHPKTEIGKVNIGSGLSKKSESVYRRRDVHVVRSADKWYRFGREIKIGEHPLKYSRPRGRRDMSIGDGGGDGEEAMVGLYAFFQTELYVPPPVIRGRIPKNAFGNLDIYTPTMVPAGGAHVIHPNASKAARILGVDYADAVTGFSFKGRIGTAVIQGCIVATEHREAVEAAIEGMDYIIEEEELSFRVREALRMWRRFHLGLNIIERVKAYASDEDEDVNVQAELDDIELERAAREAMEARDAGDMEGGGFFADDTMDVEHDLPVVRSSRRRVIPDAEDDDFNGDSGNGSGGGFLQDDEENEEGGGFIPDPADEHCLSLTNHAEAREEGGGFMADNSSDGGGFIPDATVTGSNDCADSSVSRADGPAVEAQHLQLDGGTGELHDDIQDSLESGPTNHIPTTAGSSEGPGDPTTEPRQSFDDHNAPEVMMSGALNPQLPGGEPDAETQVVEAHSTDANAKDDSISMKDASPRTEDDTGSDHGSLLSHDPEDEDADPDWLY